MRTTALDSADHLAACCVGSMIQAVIRQLVRPSGRHFMQFECPQSGDIGIRGADADRRTRGRANRDQPRVPNTTTVLPRAVSTP